MSYTCLIDNIKLEIYHGVNSIQGKGYITKKKDKCDTIDGIEINDLLLERYLTSFNDIGNRNGLKIYNKKHQPVTKKFTNLLWNHESTKEFHVDAIKSDFV